MPFSSGFRRYAKAFDGQHLCLFIDRFWDNAKITPPRTKPNVSLRVPQEVVEFFKAENPKGYTARMAAVLQAYVRAKQTAPSE